MVVPVVVEVEDPVDLAVVAHHDLVGVGDALAQGLAGVLLHLDVVKLPGKEINRFRWIAQRKRSS